MMTLAQRIEATARILWQIDAPEDPDGLDEARPRQRRDYDHNAETILRTAIPEFFTEPGQPIPETAELAEQLGRVVDIAAREVRRSNEGLVRIAALEAALRRLALMARTSGGTAGRDEDLRAACDVAEAVLAGKET